MAILQSKFADTVAFILEGISKGVAKANATEAGCKLVLLSTEDAHSVSISGDLILDLNSLETTSVVESPEKVTTRVTKETTVQESASVQVTKDSGIDQTINNQNVIDQE